ncbi:MAG: hypothetical protein M3346_09505, partial [Actinomycetota bacterium]|nr:hypothetical protein [Actinomycetota bacterium]
LFLELEPGWEPFFADANSAIDWRLVSWGGVLIDDRPEGDPNVACPNCVQETVHWRPVRSVNAALPESQEYGRDLESHGWKDPWRTLRGRDPARSVEPHIG